MNWKLIIVALSSICCLFLPSDLKSGGGDVHGESYRVGFLSPTVLGDDVFYPFYYSSAIINSASSNFTTDKIRNLTLWQKELGQEVTLLDIESILYKADYEKVMNAYKEQNLKVEFAGNTFIKALLQPKNKTILDYYLIAKENEFVNFVNTNPWGFSDDNEDFDETEARIQLIDKINDKLSTVQSEFLKQRYAYLQVVNHRYMYDAQNGLATYKKYFDENAKDIISNWALFHSASFVEDDVESNYRLSLAFDKCDSKKARIYLLFDKSLLDETIRLAKNTEEKATILAICVMNNPAPQMKVLKVIHSVDPNNPNLRGLILREISKIEDWLLTSKVTGMPKSVMQRGDNFYGYDDYEYVNGKYTKIKDNELQMYRNEVGWLTNYFNLKNYQKDVAYAREFRGFLEKLLSSNSDLNKDFLRLAISHLYFMDDEPQKALELNQQVSSTSATIKTQQAINEILLLPLIENISDESTKNKLYQSLQVVQNNLDVIERPLQTISQLHLYLSKLYFRKGDLVTAAFLHQKSSFTPKNEWHGSSYYHSISFYDRYATTNDIEKAIALLDKKNPTIFEQYILQKYTPQEIKRQKSNDERYTYGGWYLDEDIEQQKVLKSALIELQGTIAFREDKLEKSLAYFKKLPANYWESNYYFSEYLTFNPFDKSLILQDYNPYSKGKAQSKIQIVEQLITLKNEAETTQNPQLFFELGNAYYNFSHVGNSWMMFSYGKYNGEIGQLKSSSSWSYTFYPNGEKYFDIYYSSSRAKSYYEKAAELAKNNVEVRAKADFMKIKCENIVERIKGNYKNFSATKKTYDNWSETYKNTVIFNDLSSNCSYW